jgi:hypothetical protein
MDYLGSIDTIVDEDWYGFYSPGVQQVVVSVTSGLQFPDFTGLDCPGDMAEMIGPDGQEVYATDGNSFCNTVISSTQPYQHYFPVGRGRYYLRVYAANQSHWEIGPYDLRLVPSDHFVNQAYLDAAGRLGPAQRAVNGAQSAVSKDSKAIQTDKRWMRFDTRKHLWRSNRYWHRRLLADQRKLAVDRSRLRAAQATLSGVQALMSANGAPV